MNNAKFAGAVILALIALVVIFKVLALIAALMTTVLMVGVFAAALFLVFVLVRSTISRRFSS